MVSGVPRTSRGGCISPWSCLGLPTRPFSSSAGPTGPTRPTRPSTACCSHPWGESAALPQLWPAALRALGLSHRYTHTTPHHTTPHYTTPHHTTPHHTTPHTTHSSEHHAGSSLPAHLFCLRDSLLEIFQRKLLVMLGQLFDNRHRPSTCDGLLNSAQLWYSTSCNAVITDEECAKVVSNLVNHISIKCTLHSRLVLYQDALFVARCCAGCKLQ